MRTCSSRLNVYAAISSTAAAKKCGCTSYIEDDATRASLQALQLVALRAKLLSIEGLMSQGAVDEYALFRDMWLQRRNYQINQTGQAQDAPPEQTLPPYLMQGEGTPPAPSPTPQPGE